MAKPKPKEEMKLVVFKIPESVFDQLQAISKKQISDSGSPYSVPLFSRRLVLEGLRRYQQKKP
jgi:hypothetical protein